MLEDGREEKMLFIGYSNNGYWPLEILKLWMAETKCLMRPGKQILLIVTELIEMKKDTQ